MRTLLSAAAAAACIVFVGGCEAIGGLLGAGVGAAVKKEQEGEVSETFTQPLSRTRSGVLSALKRMQIEVTSAEDERIKGRAKEDPVEIKLERVTDKTTRITVKIGEALKKDRATAQEIVDQTKRALGEAK